MNIGCLISLICFPISILFTIIGTISDSLKKIKKLETRTRIVGCIILCQAASYCRTADHGKNICKIYSLPDRIEIKGGGTQFTLNKSKLTDISIISDKDRVINKF